MYQFLPLGDGVVVRVSLMPHQTGGRSTDIRLFTPKSSANRYNPKKSDVRMTTTVVA